MLPLQTSKEWVEQKTLGFRMQIKDSWLQVETNAHSSSHTHPALAVVFPAYSME
jgi:hypothetical protein